MVPGKSISGTPSATGPGASASGTGPAAEASGAEEGADGPGSAVDNPDDVKLDGDSSAPGAEVTEVSQRF